MLGSSSVVSGSSSRSRSHGSLARSQIEQDLGRFLIGVVVVCVPFFVGLGRRQTQIDPSLAAPTIIQLGRGDVDSLCEQMLKKKKNACPEKMRNSMDQNF
ncbi:hypothetical protein PIB30_049007 [Stylosanthes scabra]|uniref:Uncharacterized protein n=1 Tax=Stylosanthes scabra TaxID=79078 RepID=A0ABU6ZG01_9FABA|nr:hypothetical protein [Stylosanthes scabra]